MPRQHSEAVGSNSQHSARDRDRSKSFDFDPPHERSRSRDRGQMVREHSLPRNLPVKPTFGDGERSEASSFVSNHSAHTFSGYPMPPSTHLVSGSMGHPGTSASLPAGSISPRTPSSRSIGGYSHHNQPGMMPVPSLTHNTSAGSGHPHLSHHPSTTSSLSSRHPSQSSVSTHLDNRPMTFVRAMQVTDEIRDKRINERLRRESMKSASRKDNTKSVYDSYEASV